MIGTVKTRVTFFKVYPSCVSVWLEGKFNPEIEDEIREIFDLAYNSEKELENINKVINPDEEVLVLRAGLEKLNWWLPYALLNPNSGDILSLHKRPYEVAYESGESIRRYNEEYERRHGLDSTV